VKIKLPSNDLTKENISIKRDNKLLHFRIEKSPLSKNIKATFMTPYSNTINAEILINGEVNHLYIEEKKDEFFISSELKSFAYLELRFWNIDFINFLENYVCTKESKNLRVEKRLFQLPKRYVFSAFSALMDAEGSLDYYRHTRRIRIRMNNLSYLKDWKNILSKFEIHSHFSEEKKFKQLVVSGWEDFDKIQNSGLNLYHSLKREKWKKIMNSYKKKQVSRGTACDYYIKKLEEINKPISAKEFAEIEKKSKRVVNHYFTIMDKNNLIKIDKSKVRYMYSAK
jgi:hypothetical protein